MQVSFQSFTCVLLVYRTFGMNSTKREVLICVGPVLDFLAVHYFVLFVLLVFLLFACIFVVGIYRNSFRQHYVWIYYYQHHNYRYHIDHHHHHHFSVHVCKELQSTA